MEELKEPRRIAVKFEMGTMDQQLLTEAILLKEMQEKYKQNPFPFYIGNHSINGRKYLGIEYLEKSLPEYLD